jgi:hypothetical protein
MSSVKKFSNRINLLNNRVKYGNEGGMVVDAGTLVVNSILNNVGIQTSMPTYKLDISTNDISATRIGNTLLVDSSNNKVTVNGSIKPSSILDSTNSAGNEDISGGELYLKSTPSGLLWSAVSGGGGGGGSSRFSGINAFSSDTTLTTSHGQFIVPTNYVIFTLPSAVGNDGLTYIFLNNYNFSVFDNIPISYRIRTPNSSGQVIYYYPDAVGITTEINRPSRVVAYNGNWFWHYYSIE